MVVSALPPFISLSPEVSGLRQCEEPWHGHAAFPIDLSQYRKATVLEELFCDLLFEGAHGGFVFSYDAKRED